MISLDQVLLLQKKVESAVQKIAQLNTENDALRSKCNELTNALSVKTEQLSSFETDQGKIEEGILKALDRLNSVENSVLKTAGSTASEELKHTAAEPVATPVSVQEKPVVHSEPPVQPVQKPAENQNQKKASSDNNGQFDIF
jgi:chromosome segregation ATPase